jgi:hypothetical protein
MPEYFSQSAYATRLGVSRQAVSMAVKEGRIYKAARGIDPTHPTNKHYEQLLDIKRGRLDPSSEIVQSDAGAPVVGAPVGEPHKHTTGSAPSSAKGQTTVHYAPAPRGAPPGAAPPPSSPGHTIDLVRQGKELDNKIKAVKLSREKIDYFEQIRKSVPSTFVARAFAQIGAAIQTQFLQFDERVGEMLWSIAKSGTKEEFQAALRTEVGDAMKAVIASTEKMIRSMKTTSPGEEQ